MKTYSRRRLAREMRHRHFAMPMPALSDILSRRWRPINGAGDCYYGERCYWDAADEKTASALAATNDWPLPGRFAHTRDDEKPISR